MSTDFDMRTWKKGMLRVLAIVFLLIGIGISQADAAWEVDLGYELGDGVDPGGLNYGFTLGVGIDLDEENQFRADFLYHTYNVSWDASYDMWDSLGKSKDTTSSLTGLILSLRPYAKFFDGRVRGFLQLGFGYFLAEWEDIHPGEGNSTFWAPVLGAGAQYFLTDKVAIGAELKEFIFQAKHGVGDMTSITAGLSYFF